MTPAPEPARFELLEQLFAGTVPGSVPRVIQDWVRTALAVSRSDVAPLEASEVVRAAYAAAFELAQELGRLRCQRRVAGRTTVAAGWRR